VVVEIAATAKQSESATKAQLTAAPFSASIFSFGGVSRQPSGAIAGASKSSWQWEQIRIAVAIST
jgi:hypothetical protein